MAKTTAPLLSFDANGSMAKTMVYSRWRGVRYARRHVVPANPRTAAQQLTRNTFATLREMWKLMPTLGVDPWNSYAQGRKFLGLNAFIGENLRVVRGEADFQNFIGSPGAKGGLPPTSVVASGGGGSGELDVDFTVPAPPTGWTLASSVLVAFPDQDPATDFGGPLVAEEVTMAPWDHTLTGLTNVLHVVSGFLTWTKPNGDTAYSVGITTTGTPTA